MKQITVPFYKPFFTGNEIEYIEKALAGRISGDGNFTQKCHQFLEERLQVSRALLTTSCTHALEMCALLLELEPGDEVIVPSFTFVSTANAFVAHGARPVFIDIRPDTLNLDESLLERHISPRTRAIVPVHYAGVACEMQSILEIAAQHSVLVIEDNAHGLFGKYRGKYLGTFGDLATQSFHETKNITCGEGGALLINNEEYISRAEIIREKGTNRSKFFRGEVDKYTWVDVGSSYLPSDILAAFLYAQLLEWEQIQQTRQHIWERYALELVEWADARGVRLPTVPDTCEQAYHAFYLLMPSLHERQELIHHLKAHQISATFHYLPLHTSIMGQRFGGKVGDCPVAEDMSDRLLRLPFYNDLGELQQQYVIDVVTKF